jgi:5'-nucleotidase
MARSSRIIVFSAIAAVMTGGLLLGCSKQELTDGTVVSVLFTSDVRGKIEGCGCKHSGGGITKRSSKIKTARTEDPTVVYCDAGNWLSGTTEADQSKGMLAVDAYNELATSVVNVSERELALGMDVYRKAKHDAKFDFVSANLRAGGSAVADPYVVKRVKEARVGFIGLCGTRDVMRFDSLKLPADATIEDPVTAARRSVAALIGKTDLIVILSTCGDAVDSAIAMALPDVSLIIGGRSFRENTDAPWVIGSTRIVRSARDGRSMGRMDMVFGPDRKIKMYNPTTIAMEISDPGDERMLSLVRRYIPSFVDNPTDGVRIAAGSAAAAGVKQPE